MVKIMQNRFFEATGIVNSMAYEENENRYGKTRCQSWCDIIMRGLIMVPNNVFQKSEVCKCPGRGFVHREKEKNCRKKRSRAFE